MVLLASSLVPPTQLAAQTPAAAADPTASALQLLRERRFDEAIVLLDSLTAARPDDGNAWMMLGSAGRSAGDPARALEAHRRALAFDETRPAAMYQLGLDHALLGRPDSAFHWLQAARASGRVEMTQVALDPASESLREDRRFAALFPSAEELADPFAESVVVLKEWRGEAAGDQFGWIARNLGDVDGDEKADVLISAPTHADGAGKVYVFSAGSGVLLWAREGAPGERLGLGIEAAGDVDADGVPDAAVGAPGADVVYLLGGRDGRMLRKVTAPASGELFGRKLADAGDLDGDGHADVLIGAPGSDDGAGAVYAVSGGTGAILHRFTGGAGDRLGVPAAGDASGEPLVVLGAPEAGAEGRGRVLVYRGLADAPVFTIESDSGGAELGGMFVSVVGDVNADGAPDVYASDWWHAASGTATGRAYIHSSVDGRRLLTLTGEAAGDGYGTGTADAGDLDGDGHDDLVIGAWRQSGAAPLGGKVYVHSGRDGSILRTITGRVMGETLGFDTTGIGDVNADGTPDLLISAAWSSVEGIRSGRVYVLSGR